MFISKLLILNKTHHAHHSCNKRTESVRPTDAGSQICSGIFCAVSSEHLHQLFGSNVFQELLINIMLAEHFVWINKVC